jgi:hypothetical protein
MNYIVSFSYCVSFTIHCVRCSSCTHPVLILHSSCTHPFCILVCILCVCPVYVLSMSCPVYIRHLFRSTSSVKSYLRSNLTADSRTSPVPAILHFYSLFYYFHLRMFERFMNYIVSFSYCVSFTIHCVRHSSFLYPGVYPLCMSCLCLVYIRHSSGVHPAPNPFYHLRSNLTFGTILPRILEQVLCLRYSTFISIFITFIYRCSRDL